MEANVDGLSNYVNLVGSEIDPTTNYVLGRDCEVNYYEWFANGGLADKIVRFWSEAIGTGLKISVAAQRDSGRNKKATKQLQDWLQSEYDRLDVLSIFIAAERQCAIECAAPIVILTDGDDLLNQPIGSFDRVEMLSIQDPLYFRPSVGTLFGHQVVDHRLVESYTNARGRVSTVHASRVLPIYGKSLMVSEKWGNVKEREWGRPLIGSSVVNAAIRYEAAITIASILIEKKNMLVYGVKGFNDGMESASSDSYAMQAIHQVKMLQRASNILNVALVDLDNSKLETIDRNISGVSDLIDKSRQALLASIDNIPADFLFGERDKGGLNGNTDDMERNNNESERRFKSRWEPHLRKLNLLLINSNSCPIKNVDINSIEVVRESAYTENPTDAAETRLKILQGDRLMVSMGAITAEEVRSRHLSPTFERELLLESPKVKENESQNQLGSIEGKVSEQSGPSSRGGSNGSES